MRFETQPQDLRNIRIPATEYLIARKGPDVVIPVIPRNDAWLVSPERTWDEIDQTLEGRMAGIQNNILKDEAITLPTARLLTYTELLHEQRLLEQSLRERVVSWKNQFEKEKKQVKPYLRNRLYQQKYAPQIDHLTHESIKEHKISDLILRKAVLDIFLPTNEAILPLNVLTSSLKDIASNNLDQVHYFIDSLAEYMQTTNDKELFTNYHYRLSKNLVKTHKDITILATALSLALDSDQDNLGKAFFIFLKNRAQHVTTEVTEEFPKLSLLYDTLTAAFSLAKVKVLENVGTQIVERIFGPMLSSEYLKHEIEILAKENIKELGIVSDHVLPLQNLYEEYFTYLSFAKVDHIPVEFQQIVTTDYYRILNGLGFIMNLSGSANLHGLDKTIPSVKRILTLNKEKVGYLTKNWTNQEKTELAMVTTGWIMLPKQQVYSVTGIEADLSVYILHHKQTVYDTRRSGPELGFTRESWQKEKFKIFESLSLDQPDERLETILTNYFMYNWQEEKPQVAYIERQNEQLKHEILDKALWFVSPRGDRFSRERDPELDTKEINAISFYPDPSHPREHQMIIDLTGLHDRIRIWLDTSGKLLKEDRGPLILGAANYQLLTNIILKRLYVVTSGMLSNKDEAEYGSEDEVKLTLTWRRAHYRVYKAGSIYTLESEAAQAHADEILRTYGIDIFKEIKRRQEIGTLLPNQVMTFVKEVSPKLPSGKDNTNPNDLSFDPTWIPIKY